LPDGSAPTTNTVAQEQCGWAFDLNNQSNIIFQACHFIAADPLGNDFGAIRHTIPTFPFTTAAHNITFTNCTSFDTQTFSLYPGENGFSFLSCEFGRFGSAVYSVLNGTLTAPQQLTVSNCFLHDGGTPEYQSADNDAIGIQAGNYHVITHNTISNTGPGITFWTGNISMRSNIISYNFVINTQLNAANVSDGIALTGDNVGATPGYRLGNRIFGNIVCNPALGTGLGYEGVCINLNSPDFTPVENNTIYGGNSGINWQVVQPGQAVNGVIVNNIIVNSAQHPYYIVGQISSTNLVIDHNLYYPQILWIGGGAAGRFELSPYLPGHDAHSIYANPIFAGSTLATAGSFALSAASPAIGAGVTNGLSEDIIGTPIYPNRSPDIGAYEFAINPPTNLHVLPKH